MWNELAWHLSSLPAFSHRCRPPRLTAVCMPVLDEDSLHECPKFGGGTLQSLMLPW
jgi:hypothetical protein